MDAIALAKVLHAELERQALGTTEDFVEPAYTIDDVEMLGRFDLLRAAQVVLEAMGGPAAPVMPEPAYRREAGARSRWPIPPERG